MMRRIQHLKEVIQVDEIAVFPFVSNSDMFDLSHVALPLPLAKVSAS